MNDTWFKAWNAMPDARPNILSAFLGGSLATATTKPRGGDVEGEVEYVSTVAFSIDYVVISRMAIIGAMLALVSSTSAIASILRYNPLAILAERN